jgi:hypothetical protein
LQRRAVLGLGLAVLAGVAGAQAASGDLALVMVRTAGCPWCLAWDREVRAGYLASDIGARLGLVELDLREVDGQGMALEGPVTVSPVFVLVRRAPGADGLAGAAEIGRLVGYPGADFFWGYLDGWLAEAGAAAPG